ncbi:MAG: type II secretion system F family protein [Sandaracinaceae bacterium]|nr:type II secretion system F family protein [Sandaracinaceae bacterium]
MAEFVWEARARTGETRKGIMEAENVDAVQNRLKAQNLAPVKVKKKPKEYSLSFGSPVSDQELVVFTRQFGTMIDAGLPLVQCLEILSGQGGNKELSKVLKDIKGNVEQGATFSDSLKRHPKIFDDLYVNLVAAGELGGILDTILNRLSVYIEKRVKLKRQVKSALVYPTVIGLVAITVLVVLLTWVIPTFQAMFSDFGGEDALPGITRFVIGLSHWFVGNIIWIILLSAGAFFGTSYSYRTKGGKEFWHRTLLTVPVLGPVMRKIAVARFTRTLGTLLASGVPILDAMNIVARSAGNVIVERAINVTSDKIREGRTMAEPLMETKVFPPMVVQMIGVGEQTGALDAMLNKIADFYEEEVDVAVAALTSMLEPLMMVVIGGMVGFMLIAMYMPIFDIAGHIQAE